MKTKEEQIKKYIAELNDSDLISLYNQYCQEVGYSDDEIFYNDDEFFEIYFDSSVISAVRAISYGEYNYTDKFVKFNGHGNLDSYDYLTDLIDFPEMASYIADNIDSFDLDIDFEEEED